MEVLIFWLNPMTAIVEVILISGRSKALGGMGSCSVLSLLVFYSGLRIYRRLRPAFADAVNFTQNADWTTQSVFNIAAVQ